MVYHALGRISRKRVERGSQYEKSIVSKLMEVVTSPFNYYIYAFSSLHIRSDHESEFGPKK